MHLFLHIIFREDELVFESEMRIWLKQHLPKAHYFDVDQRSEDLVMKTAIEAVEHADCIFSLIEGTTSNPQPIFKIIKKLQSAVAKSAVCVVNNSDSELIAKLGKTFGSNWKDSIDQKELKQLIKIFFTTPD